MEIYSGVFCWTNWVFLFSLVVEGWTTQFTGALFILFLGIPMLAVIIYTRAENRLNLLLLPESKIESGDLCRKKNFFYFYIIDTRDMFR